MTTNLCTAPALAVLLLGLSASPALRAAEGYVTWDNFDGATSIDETRWLDKERRRIIESGALRLIQRDVGNQSDNTSFYFNSFTTNLTNPAAVTQMKATITVNAFDLKGCAGNPGTASIQARLVGSFFNTGPGTPSSSNRVNDVGATVRLRRDSSSADGATVLRVQASVYQCTTADCNGSISLGDVDLGTASIGEAVTLRMEWDKPNKRFNFYRGSDPVQRVAYAVSDAIGPGLLNRQLGTRTALPNCVADRSSARVDAKFDNLYVNASAAPPP